MKIVTKDHGVEIDFEAKTTRRCGECTLCCKLLPNVALDKPAGKVCQHQRHGQGCKIYPSRPAECQMWSCRWLAEDPDTAGMKRPDRAHYVIDILPDTVRVTPNPGVAGEPIELEALQVWVDPAFPEAANDPALRAYMAKMAQDQGMPTLLRWSNRSATAVFPPAMNDDREWHEAGSRCTEEAGFGRFSQLPRSWQDSLRKSR